MWYKMGQILINVCLADKTEFADHKEMLQYVFNSCVANGRIGDGLDLVRSQQHLCSFDYPFAFAEGV